MYNWIVPVTAISALGGAYLLWGRKDNRTSPRGRVSVEQRQDSAGGLQQLMQPFTQALGMISQALGGKSGSGSSNSAAGESPTEYRYLVDNEAVSYMGGLDILSETEEDGVTWVELSDGTTMEKSAYLQSLIGDSKQDVKAKALRDLDLRVNTNENKGKGIRLRN